MRPPRTYLTRARLLRHLIPTLLRIIRPRPRHPNMIRSRILLILSLRTLPLRHISRRPRIGRFPIKRRVPISRTVTNRHTLQQINANSTIIRRPTPISRFQIRRTRMHQMINLTSIFNRPSQHSPIRTKFPCHAMITIPSIRRAIRPNLKRNTLTPTNLLFKRNSHSRFSTMINHHVRNRAAPPTSRIRRPRAQFRLRFTTRRVRLLSLHLLRNNILAFRSDTNMNRHQTRRPLMRTIKSIMIIQSNLHISTTTISTTISPNLLQQQKQLLRRRKHRAPNRPHLLLPKSLPRHNLHRPIRNYVRITNRLRVTDSMDAHRARLSQHPG